MADGHLLEGICADCSSSGPTWGSLNRGVLVCDECCGVHRSLGRHISHIRSLHSANWPPSLREMISTLVRKGSNAVWEHALRESGSKVKIKKPGPRDKHNLKENYIISKYKHLALLPKGTLKESANITDDLSKQLHASVRTSNLETCLRLLSMNANPNYMHPERKTTPLHVAARAGQLMQAELLVVYGANPCTLDMLGHTPQETARIAGYHELADRLTECQYELTDRLSVFLCGRKPLHSNGEHYLIPPTNNAGTSEARSRLQELSNDLFEELAADIYDEVDRRETDAVWLTTQQLHSSVPFLPVNPSLSPMRNQGRQKLATLDAKEFSQLVIDILLETNRRQNISLETGQHSGTVVPTMGGMMPDHDYEDVPIEGEEEPSSHLTPPVESDYSIVGEELNMDFPERVEEVENEEDEEDEEKKKAPQSVYSHLREKSRSNTPLQKAEPADQYSTVEGSIGVERLNHRSLSTSDQDEGLYSLATEPSSLNERPQKILRDKPSLPRGPPPARPHTAYSNRGILDRPSGSPIDRGLSSPISPSPLGDTVPRTKFNVIMDQLRRVQKEKDEILSKNEHLNKTVAEMQLKINQLIAENNKLKKVSDSTESARPHSPLPVLSVPTPSPEANLSSEQLQDTPTYAIINKRPAQRKPLKVTNSYPSQANTPSPHPPVTSITPSPPASQSSPIPQSPLPHPSAEYPSSSRVSHSVSSSEGPSPAPSTGKGTPVDEPAFEEEATPTIEEVNMGVKHITHCIQDLLRAAQSQRVHEFVPCAQKISSAVGIVTKTFISKSSSPEVSASLKELERSARQLQSECRMPSQRDASYHTKLIMNSAYDVAKAARFLVTSVEEGGR